MTRIEINGIELHFEGDFQIEFNGGVLKVKGII